MALAFSHTHTVALCGRHAWACLHPALEETQQGCASCCTLIKSNHRGLSFPSLWAAPVLHPVKRWEAFWPLGAQFLAAVQGHASCLWILSVLGLLS